MFSDTTVAKDLESMRERIGRYRIVDILGEGGMGVVYAAQDERLQRLVAIKMLRGDGLDEQASKRLWREARVAAAANHPNICQIYEIGEEGGRLFIAMELLEGESLAWPASGPGRDPDPAWRSGSSGGSASPGNRAS